MQQTFAIIKPDAVAKNQIGAILAVTEAAGFKIRAAQLTQMTRKQAEGFYGVHRERPFFGELEGVDFSEVGIDGFVGLGEGKHGLNGGVDAAGRDAHAEGEVAGLIGLHADAGFDGFLEDLFRGVRGDFFDIHAAFGGAHEDELAGNTVEHDAGVVFLVDRQLFFNEEALHETAFGAGLVGYEGHAEDFFGLFAAFGGVGR